MLLEYSINKNQSKSNRLSNLIKMFLSSNLNLMMIIKYK